MRTGAETTAIAEEGFIYGLPPVMNFAVMNECVVDRNSGQYKAQWLSAFLQQPALAFNDLSPERNWLPAPNGPIFLMMRLYWPQDAPPSILPPGEGTWKPPAVVAAQ